jgi:uncharacterized protein (TIGR03067 family)
MVAGALAAVAVLAAAGRTPADDKAAADKIEGKWAVVSLVGNGKEDEKAKDDTVTFEAGTIHIKEKNGEHSGTYKLDASQKPPTIDLTPDDGPQKGKTLKGIYSLKGDELKICLPHDPDKDRPTKFESTEGSGLMCVTLKREKP